MANEKRLIDANRFLRETRFKEGIYPHKTLKTEIDEQPTVDAVPAEKYNELKERYERMKEIADILDTALRQYQRQYGE